MPFYRSILWVAALVSVAGLMWWWLYEPPAEPVRDNYQLQWHECESQVQDAPVDCATLLTPADEGSFRLPVAVLRYTGSDAREEPLLYLQGGPGASAGLDAQGLSAWVSWRDYAGLKRDLVLVDRRGTGGSAPRPDCPRYERVSRQMLARNYRLERELAESRELLMRCWRSSGADPAHYGTRASARDMRALMALLPASRWHALGVSYGSRLGLEVARQAPGLQTLVLDGVYPPGQGGLANWPETLSKALDNAYAGCLARPECAELKRQLLPDQSMREALFRALQSLKQKPMRVSLTLDHLAQTLVVNDHRFLSAVFAAGYQRHRWPELVAALAAVPERDRGPVKALMQRFVRQAFSSNVTDLTFSLVDCRDNPAGKAADFERKLIDYPKLAAYLRPQWTHQLCREWPAGQPLELPASPPPRLALLAGQYDPITPPEWARALHRQWPQSALTLWRDTGHGVLGGRACALTQLEDYLAGRIERFSRCR